MKSIYNFESVDPPKITEKMLFDVSSRRILRKQTILISFASLLTNISIALLSVYISRIRVEAGIICLLFFCFSLIGNGLITVLFIYQRRRNYHVISY